MRRGEVWWASLPDPVGSGPGFRRPAVVVQSNRFNNSRIETVVVATVTSNMRLAASPGNVLLRPQESGLSRDSVVNVSQVITLDRALLTERVSSLPVRTLVAIDNGLKLVLGL